MISQAKENQKNPVELFKQVMGNYSPEQAEKFYQQVEKMGFPPEMINQLKDGINTK